MARESRGLSRSLPRVDRGLVVWALPAAGALALGPLLEHPAWAAGVVVGALGAAGAIVGVRRLGAGGAWLAALAGSILLGEMAAVGFGGQSGRLLWADGVLALGIAVALAREGSFEIPRAPFLVALGPFLAWSAVGLLWAPDPLTGLAELKEWMVAAIAGAAAVAWARDARRARQLLGTVTITGALVALAMAWTAARHPMGWVMAVMLKLVDLPWGRSNYLAGLLLLACPLALGLLGHARGARARVAWTACLGALALGLVVSASKGAILALLIAWLVAYLPARDAGRTTRLAMLGAIAAGIALYLATPLHQVLTYRLAAGALDYSSGERMALYRLAWDCFLHHPLLGIGLNNFSVAANALHGIDTVPHNLELGLLAELGPLGLALGLGFLAVVGRACWRVRAGAADRAERSLGLGLWTAWLAFVLHNQIESTIYGEQMKLLFVMVAAAAWRLVAPAPRSSPTSAR